MTETVQLVNPPQLGPAIAPYSQAAIHGGVIYLAGQVGLDAQNEVVAPGDVSRQTAYALGRVRTILNQFGAELRDVVTATVYLTDLNDFARFNAAWAQEFGEHRPARATVIAGLLLPGLVVEIQLTAAIPA